MKTNVVLRTFQNRYVQIAAAVVFLGVSVYSAMLQNAG